MNTSDSDIETDKLTFLSVSNFAIQDSFVDWDFTTIWEIVNGKYPTLKEIN